MNKIMLAGGLNPCLNLSLIKTLTEKFDKRVFRYISNQWHFNQYYSNCNFKFVAEKLLLSFGGIQVLNYEWNYVVSGLNTSLKLWLIKNVDWEIDKWVFPPHIKTFVFPINDISDNLSNCNFWFVAEKIIIKLRWNSNFKLWIK